ncbi:hypothetical protein [Burkholderia vietnamiensis]|uniref:hypothetical protein n=1 Tax=Burkholderia vietnamiensis TaxID=60552 RepID=UPI001CF4E5C5|nr:hypothetical protein [Burkholderia vietnamiensis]MCA8198478.1 hypothetical protein [Burkholderia vietnamiensis]
MKLLSNLPRDLAPRECGAFEFDVMKFGEIASKIKDDNWSAVVDTFMVEVEVSGGKVYRRKVDDSLKKFLSKRFQELDNNERKRVTAAV